LSDRHTDLTRILGDMARGDSEAGAQLMPLVYEELRRLAAMQMPRDQLNVTLQPTALVHEVYMRLARSDGKEPFEGSGHFFSVAAKAMRQIAVDQARKRRAQKRGGDWGRVTLRFLPDEESGAALDALALEDALTRLAEAHPRPAQVAELRFFAGLDVDEVATALDVSPRTVKYDWRFARAWLRDALAEDES